MLHSYHVTIYLPDGSRRVQASLCFDSAAAASAALDLYPSATRLDVLRLTTALLRAGAMPCRGAVS